MMPRGRATRSDDRRQPSVHGRRRSANGVRPPPPRRREAAQRPARHLSAEPMGVQKLLVMIVADVDADGLVRALVPRGYSTTKIGSTGGFLRRGNTTLLCGVPAAEVEGVLALVRQLCPARTELLTVGGILPSGDAGYLTEPAEVRVGGAVVFVLPVERFERV